MPCCNTAPYKRLQRVLRRPCNSIPPTPQNSARGFTEAFPAICRIFSLLCGGVSSYTAPPATRWSISQRRSASSVYPIPVPRRTLYRSAQPPYYNKVYKSIAVRPLLWIHARRGSIPQTIPARRGRLLPCADRWQVLHLAHLLRGQCLHLYRASPAATAAALFGLSPDSQ